MTYAYLFWRVLFSKSHLAEIFQKRIKRNPSVGMDGVTVYKFEENLDDEIDIIIRKVNNFTYSFTRYKKLLFNK